MVKNPGRFAAFAAFAIALFILAGCSGGGGGGGSPSVVPAAPTAAFRSSTPVNNATGVTVGSAVTIVLDVTGAASSDASNLSWACNSKTVSFTSASSLSTDGKTMMITMIPAANTSAAGDMCSYSGSVTTTGPGGTVPTSVSSSYTNAVAPVPAPTATVSSYSPAAGATGVVVGTPFVVTLSVTNATNATTAGLSWICAGTVVPFTSGSSLSMNSTTMVVALTPSANASSAGNACTVTGDVTVVGPSGNVSAGVNSSYTNAAAVIPVPTATVSSYLPASGATGVAANVTPVISMAVTNATSGSPSGLTLVCSGANTTFTANTVVVNGVSTTTVTPAASLTLSSTCVIGGYISTTGAGGTIQTQVSDSFTVVAPVAPPPVTPTCTAPMVLVSGVNICMYPQGMWVVGANQLPNGCNSVSQQCWKDAVANGTVKAILSGMTLTGYSTRPMGFYYFRNTSTAFGVTGLWNFAAFYTDDGSLAGGGIDGGSTQAVDAVYGNATGLMIHGSAGCAQDAWNNGGTNIVGTNGPVACAPGI